MGNTFVKPGKSTERVFGVSDVVVTLGYVAPYR